MIGAICRQGAHHSAQKSTIAGISDFRISASKFWSVTSWLDAMLALSPPSADRARGRLWMPPDRRRNGRGGCGSVAGGARRRIIAAAQRGRLTLPSLLPILPSLASPRNPGAFGNLTAPVGGRQRMRDSRIDPTPAGRARALLEDSARVKQALADGQAEAIARAAAV